MPCMITIIMTFIVSDNLFLCMFTTVDKDETNIYKHI